MTAPLIGVTGRRKPVSALRDAPEILQHLYGDWFYADYANGVREAGGLPVFLPVNADAREYAHRLDGILLSGGADIGPEHYGAESETDEYPPEPERDRFELDLLDGAVEAQIPVLGICRGLQMVNVHAGGTLHQHVPEHAMFNDAPDLRSHRITTAEGSTLHGLYGDTLQVNSLHHQTVDKLGANLVATATHDGAIEGLERTDLPIVAVQWHPEMLDSRTDDPIFKWLVEQAST